MAKNQAPATPPAAEATPAEQPAAPEAPATPPAPAATPAEQPAAPEAPATPPAAEAPAASVKARVLRDCEFGSVNDVVEVPADQLEHAVNSGCVDPHPDAVAYAESLQ